MIIKRMVEQERMRLLTEKSDWKTLVCSSKDNNYIWLKNINFQKIKNNAKIVTDLDFSINNFCQTQSQTLLPKMVVLDSKKE